MTIPITETRPVPERVRAARGVAERLDFAYACTDEVGRLLAALAATATGRIAESGTGVGVGTAWLRSGLREGAEIVTVERDLTRAAAAAELFADDDAVTVLYDDWTALRRHAPYGLLFVDGGGKDQGVDAWADLVRPGGIVVMDDFTASTEWPPTRDGAVDTLRLGWLTDPRFAAVELGTGGTTTAIIATRR